MSQNAPAIFWTHISMLLTPKRLVFKDSTDKLHDPSNNTLLECYSCIYTSPSSLQCMINIFKMAETDGAIDPQPPKAV
jgi:hypothetical protein